MTDQKSPRVGRKKQWTKRITLPLAEGTTERIDAILRPQETRVDFIRDAVAGAIRRRKNSKAKPAGK